MKFSFNILGCKQKKIVQSANKRFFVDINLKSNLKRNIFLLGETNFNPSIFSTLKKTLKMQKMYKKRNEFIYFLPTFMLLFGHAKLHKKRRLSRKHKFLHAIYFFQCCVTNISRSFFLLLSIYFSQKNMQ